MATTGEGTIEFDFGSGGGSNLAVVTVASQTGFTTSSRLELYLDGTLGTATHNSYEHSIIELGGFSMTVISKATDTFTVQAATLLRLTGTIAARFIWAT